MNEWLIGFRVLLKKEVLRYYKVIAQTIFSPMINASLYLLIFGVNLADRITEQNGLNYLQFIIPGLMAMGLLNNSFQNAASSVIISKFHGDLQDLKVVPLRQSQIIWAYALAATSRGILVGIGVTLVGEVFYFLKYDQLLPVYDLFSLISFMILGGSIFGFIGLSISIYAKSFDQVNAVGNFILLPLIYLGGVFFSLGNMHPIWQWISKFNPLLYLINGFRYSFLGVSDIPVSFSFQIALIFVLLAFGVAFQALKKGSYTRF